MEVFVPWVFAVDSEMYVYVYIYTYNIIYIYSHIVIYTV